MYYFECTEKDANIFKLYTFISDLKYFTMLINLKIRYYISFKI